MAVVVAAPAPEALPATALSATALRPSPLQPPLQRTHFASIARGAAALLSTQPVTWAATFLTTVFVPRFLGAEGLGQYTVALTLAGIAGMVASLGVPDYLRRRVATHGTEAHADAGAALLALTAISVLVAAAALPIIVLAGDAISDHRVLALALAAMVVVTAQSVVSSFLVGQERHGAYAWLNAAGVVLAAALGIGVLSMGGDVVAFAVTALGAAVVTFFLSWVVSGLRLSTGALDVRRWRSLATGGMPFMGWNVALRIRCQIDVVVVAALLGERTAGWLAGAYRVIAVPFFIPNLIAVPLLPALSRCAREESAEVFRHTLRRSLVTVLALTLPLSALMIALAPSIPTLLGWGPDFDHTVPLVILLALAQPLSAADIVLGTGLFALSRERVWVRVAAAAAVFNPALNLLFVPVFERLTGNGGIGAGIVEGLTELIMFCGALLLLPTRVLDRWMAWFGVRCILASGALGAAYWALRPFGPLVAAAGASLVFLAAGAVLGVVNVGALWHERANPLRAFDVAFPSPPLEEVAAVERDDAAPSLLDYLRGDLAAWARLWAPQYEGGSDPIPPLSLRLAARLLWQHVGLRAIFVHRLSHVLWRRRVKAIPQLLSQLNVMLHGLDVPAGVEIGPGLYVPHPVGTVVMARRIGRNLTLVSGVTVGMRHVCEFPEIGDDVYIGAGARILGAITVGSGAKIGANAVVLRDVPAGATAVGIPARVIAAADRAKAAPHPMTPELEPQLNPARAA